MPRALVCKNSLQALAFQLEERLEEASSDKVMFFTKRSGDFHKLFPGKGNKSSFKIELNKSERDRAKSSPKERHLRKKTRASSYVDDQLKPGRHRGHVGHLPFLKMLTPRACSSLRVKPSKKGRKSCSLVKSTFPQCASSQTPFSLCFYQPKKQRAGQLDCLQFFQSPAADDFGSQKVKKFVKGLLGFSSRASIKSLFRRFKQVTKIASILVLDVFSLGFCALVVGFLVVKAAVRQT